MQQLNPSEISDIIKKRIEKLDISSEAKNEGTILSVSDGIVLIHGLADVMYGEMIEFANGTFGMALNLERDSVGAVVLGDYEDLAEGQKVRCTGRILEVPVGPELMGRVVDALGNPIDGKGDLGTDLTSPVEKVAPGVIARQSVSMLPSVRSSLPSLPLCASWKSTALWITPLWLPPVPPTLQRCSSWLRTPVPPWVNTSVTVAKTP